MTPVRAGAPAEIPIGMAGALEQVRLWLCAPRIRLVYVLGSLRCSSSRRSFRCCLAALRSLRTSCLLAFSLGLVLSCPKFPTGTNRLLAPIASSLPNFGSEITLISRRLADVAYLAAEYPRNYLDRG